MMLRRKESSKYQSNRQLKSIMNKLLLFHSNYILSQFNSIQSKASPPNPCLRPATSSINRSKSHKKSAIGLGESTHMQFFNVAGIKDQFMTVSKKKIFQKQNKNSVHINSRKDMENNGYNQAQFLQALKSCKVSRVFSKNFPSRHQKRQILKATTLQNESKSSPFMPKPYKLISQKKSTDTSVNNIKEIQKVRPWTSFKNSQLKKVIKMKDKQNEISNNFTWKNNKSKQFTHESADNSEFNPWVAQYMDISQF